MKNPENSNTVLAPDLFPVFCASVGNYCEESWMIKHYWNKIENAYAQTHRHYHTLEHIAKMYAELLSVKDMISDWDSVVFALFYHDYVYDPLTSDMEEQSRMFADMFLKAIEAPEYIITRTDDLILASEAHWKQGNTDIDVFIDADLAILGADAKTYNKYKDGIRKEYADIHDEVFYPKRLNLLKYFLEQKTIFSTKHFIKKYEVAAVRNIEKEVRDLLKKGW